MRWRSSEREDPLMTAIDELLIGAIDLHTHSGPSPMPRRITHVEAARQASEAGFRAILVKCHYHSTIPDILARSEEHTSELQSLMRTSYAVFCLKKKTTYH